MTAQVGGFQNPGVCLQAFPSFLPHPLPALLLAPLFSRSLTLVPRSFLLNRTETLATQATWVTNYLSNRGFLTCLSWIVSIDRELHSQTFRAKIWLKFSEFFYNIPLRILLDVLFRVFRFSKASFYALTSSFMTFQNFVAILKRRRTAGCHGNSVISHVKLQINAEIWRQN